MSNKYIRYEMISNYPKKKKIGFLFNHSYFLGGGEISLFELIRKLDREKFEPIVFVPDTGEIEQKLRSQKIITYQFALPSGKRNLNLVPIRALANLIKLIKTKKIDILHMNGSRACFYGAVATRAAGIPAIWHVRETKRDLFLYDFFLAIMSKVIVCVSKSVRNKRFGVFGRIIKNKIFVVYNGVDTQIFKKNESAKKRVKKKLGVEDQLFFGIVGNIIPLKGQNEFLKGFAKAKKKNPGISAKVLLIGRLLDKAYHKLLLSQIQKLELSDDIIFIDYMPNIIDILSALDVFVLPSKREGFSRSMLEAMSCELPIIASKIEAIEEAAVDEKNAILVDINNIDKMAAAIITLCEDSSLRNEMGLLNRKIAEKQFSLLPHTEAIESIYNGLLHKKSCTNRWAT